MTTAHRATWKPAHGGAGEDGSFSLHAPSAATSSRDAPAHEQLKKREPRGDAATRAERLRQELAARERAAARARAVDAVTRGEVSLHSLGADAHGGVDDVSRGDSLRNDKPALSDRGEFDEGPGFQSERVRKRRRTEDAAGSCSDGLAIDSRSAGKDVVCSSGEEEDADLKLPRRGISVGGQAESEESGEENDVARYAGGPSDEDDVSDDDSEDDDPEALRAELERIRAERAAKRESDARAAVVGGNPLLPHLGSTDADTESVKVADSEISFAVKRRWDDDVVFRNQAKREPKQEVRFINDTTRNDYHRKFLRRFIG